MDKMKEDIIMELIKNLDERITNLNKIVELEMTSQKLLGTRVDLCSEAIEILKDVVFDDKEEEPET